MSVLHIVNKSPFDRNSLDSCLRLAKADSAILIDRGRYLRGAKELGRSGQDAAGAWQSPVVCTGS